MKETNTAEDLITVCKAVINKYSKLPGWQVFTKFATVHEGSIGSKKVQSGSKMVQ